MFASVVPSVGTGGALFFEACFCPRPSSPNVDVGATSYSMDAMPDDLFKEMIFIIKKKSYW